MTFKLSYLHWNNMEGIIIRFTVFTDIINKDKNKDKYNIYLVNIFYLTDVKGDMSRYLNKQG